VSAFQRCRPALGVRSQIEHSQHEVTAQMAHAVRFGDAPIGNAPQKVHMPAAIERVHTSPAVGGGC
jgi:hypothetical protein